MSEFAEHEAQLEYVDPEFPDVRTGWHISSDAELDWALGKLADVEREKSRNETVLQAAIARLQMRHEALQARLERDASFFRGAIASYAENNKAKLIPGKRKSCQLLHGLISWRKTGGGLQVQDKEALLEWARSQPVERGVLRIKEEPAVDVIREHFKRTGEVPPGCDLAPERDELSIKPLWGDGGSANE